MARLPDFTALPQQDPRATGGSVTFPTTDPVNTATAALGTGIAGVGSAIANFAEERQRDRDKLDESNATVDLVSRLIPLHTQASQETDPAKLGEIKKQYDTLLSTSSQALANNPLRQKMWMAAHSKTILEAHAEADKRTVLLGRNRATADSLDRIDLVVKNSVVAPDPMALKNAELAINTNLTALEAAGAILPEESRVKRRAAIEELYKGAADRLANQGNAQAAIDLLNKNPEKVDATTAQARIAHYQRLGDRAADDAIVGNIFGGPIPGTTGPRGVPRGTSGAGSSETAQRIAKVWKEEFGWTDAAIVGGLAGGALPESSMTVWGLKGPGGENGLFQFHPGSHLPIFERQSRGDTSPEAQARYVANWMKDKMPTYGATSDKVAATNRFHDEFEAPKLKSKDKPRHMYISTAETLLGGAGAAAVGSTPRPFNSVIGDSIGVGVMDAAKLPGDAEDGRTTQQVLDAIVSSDPIHLKGKRIFLSSGASNSPDALDMVPQQLDALKAAGADVVLSGVGSGVKNYQAVNTKLAEHAKAAGVPFTGEIPGTQGGRVHPRDYGPLAKQAAGMGGRPAAPTPGGAATPPRPELPPGMPTRDEMIARIPEGLSEERYNSVYAKINQRYNRILQATSAERAQMQKEYTGALAMLQDGREFEIDPVKYRRLFPTDIADQMIGELQDARAVGQQITSVRGMPLSDIVSQRIANEEILKRSTGPEYAKQRKLADAFTKASEMHIKALGEDPAEYVNLHNPEIAGLRSAAETPGLTEQDRQARFGQYATVLRAEQKRLGVPEDGQRILSKMQATQLAASIARTDPDKGDVGFVMQNIAKDYGAAWPMVMGDLKRAGLPPQAEAFMSMVPEPGAPDVQAAARVDMQHAMRIAAQKGGDKTLRSTAPQANAKQIDDDVDSTLADFRGSVRDPNLYATMETAVKELAYYYAFRGEPASSALEKAYQGIIGQKYDFDGRLRVPKGMLGTVEAAGQQLVATITPEQLGQIRGNRLLTQQERVKIYQEALPRGYWVANARDDGVELMLPLRDGEQVALYADGSPIAFSFVAAPMLALGGRDTVQPGLPDSRMRRPPSAPPVMGVPGAGTVLR